MLAMSYGLRRIINSENFFKIWKNLQLRWLQQQETTYNFWVNLRSIQTILAHHGHVAKIKGTIFLLL